MNARAARIDDLARWVFVLNELRAHLEAEIEALIGEPENDSAAVTGSESVGDPGASIGGAGHAPLGPNRTSSGAKPDGGAFDDDDPWLSDLIRTAGDPPPAPPPDRRALIAEAAKRKPAPPLRARDIVFRPGGKMRKGERTAQVVAVAKKVGQDPKAIAARLGIPREQVWEILGRAQAQGLIPKAAS